MQYTTQNLINKFLELLVDQDADGIGELFTDEIDWYVPGNPALPWVGQRSQRAEVADYFRTMWPWFEAGKSITRPGGLFISGDEAIVFATFTHTVVSTGRSFTTPVALHLTVAEGKIHRLHLYEDTWVVNKAFFD